jgi:hypothetical protein
LTTLLARLLPELCEGTAVQPVTAMPKRCGESFSRAYGCIFPLPQGL